MLSRRFGVVCKDIENLAEQENGPPGSKNNALTTLYFEHNEVCELVDEANVFWQSYVFFTYMSYIPCSCYALYNLFFADFDNLLAVVTWGSFFQTVILIGYISVSAAGVSAEVCSCCSRSSISSTFLSLCSCSTVISLDVRFPFVVRFPFFTRNPNKRGWKGSNLRPTTAGVFILKAVVYLNSCLVYCLVNKGCLVNLGFSFHLNFFQQQAHAPYTALHTLSLLQLPIDLEVNVSEHK